MKKTLLLTALAVASLSTADAKWDGAYMRGGLEVRTQSSTNQLNEIAQPGDLTVVTLDFKLGAGYGQIFANSVYLGIDASVANLSILYNTTIYGSKTEVAWNPNLQLRVGMPMSLVMPYVAGGLGYNKVVIKPDEGDTEEGKMTWSVRAGSAFKVTESFSVDAYFQWVKRFNTETGEGAAKKTTGSSAGSVGVDFAWTF